MARTISFAPGEWYHCYSRGVDKRVIFTEPDEYERFQTQMYAANSIRSIQVSGEGKSFQGPTLEQPRGERLVDLGAYALMPSHYHFLLRERVEGGITSFMRRLNTGYTMYFNLRHERTGALFSGKFKANHVDSNEYLRRLVHYIHGNPAELIEKGWKQGRMTNEISVHNFLRSYPYSSLGEYEQIRAKSLTDTEELLELLEDIPNASATIQDAKDFGEDRLLEAF